MKKAKTEIETSEKNTDVLLLEAIQPLSDESKLVILGIARGIAMSTSIPTTG